MVSDENILNSGADFVNAGLALSYIDLESSFAYKVFFDVMAFPQLVTWVLPEKIMQFGHSYLIWAKYVPLGMCLKLGIV